MTKPVIAVPVNTKEPALPKWAQRGLEGPTIEVSGEEVGEEAPSIGGSPDKNLPKWALKGLQRYVHVFLVLLLKIKMECFCRIM